MWKKSSQSLECNKEVILGLVYSVPACIDRMCITYLVCLYIGVRKMKQKSVCQREQVFRTKAAPQPGAPEGEKICASIGGCSWSPEGGTGRPEGSGPRTPGF